MGNISADILVAAEVSYKATAVDSVSNQKRLHLEECTTPILI